MGLLSGKVAIVTGAGAGLGRSHALALAAQGAKVIVNDLGGDRHGGGQSGAAAEVVKEIKQAGGEAAPSFDNVATLDGAARMVWTAVSKYGRLDVLVNNAGILRDKTLLNMAEADWDAVVAVHLKGSFLCLQQAARAMKTQGTGGSIINTTSLSGLLGNFGQANYGAAKGGIYSLTRVSHVELFEAQKDPAQRIRVNALAPVAYTRMTSDLPMMQGMTESHSPERVTPMVTYLASDLAKEVSGRVLGAEGGRFFEYKMTLNDGWTKDAVAAPEEIAEHMKKILQ